MSVSCELDEINGRRRRYLRRAREDEGRSGFWGSMGAKWDRRVGRVRFNSDSDVSVGHVDWQAFGATVHPPFSSFSLEQRATKSGDGGDRGQPGEQITRVKCARALFSRVNVA